MSSNPNYSELANWDGKLSGSSPSTPSAANSAGSRTPNTQTSPHHLQNGSHTQEIPTHTPSPPFPKLTSSPNHRVVTATNGLRTMPSSLIANSFHCVDSLQTIEHEDPSNSTSLHGHDQTSLAPSPVLAKHSPPNALNNSLSTSLSDIKRPTQHHTLPVSVCAQSSEGDMDAVDAMLRPSSSSVSSIGGVLPHSPDKKGSVFGDVYKLVVESISSPAGGARNTRPPACSSSPLPPSSPEKCSEVDSIPPSEPPTLTPWTRSTLSTQLSEVPSLGDSSHTPQAHIDKIVSVASEDSRTSGRNVQTRSPEIEKSTTLQGPVASNDESYPTSPSSSKPSQPVRSSSLQPGSSGSPQKEIRVAVIDASSPRMESPPPSSNGQFARLNLLAREAEITNLVDDTVMADLTSAPDPNPRDPAPQIDSFDQHQKANKDIEPGVPGESPLRLSLRSFAENAPAPFDPSSPLTTISSSSSSLRSLAEKKADSVPSNRSRPRNYKGVKSSRMVFAGVFVPPLPRGVSKRDYIDLTNVSVSASISRDAIESISTPRERPVKAKTKKRKATLDPSTGSSTKKRRLSPSPSVLQEEDALTRDQGKERTLLEFIGNGAQGLDPLSQLFALDDVEIEETDYNLSGLYAALVRLKQGLVPPLPGGADAPTRRSVVVELEEGDLPDRMYGPVDTPSQIRPQGDVEATPPATVPNPPVSTNQPHTSTDSATSARRKRGRPKGSGRPKVSKEALSTIPASHVPEPLQSSSSQPAQAQSSTPLPASDCHTKDDTGAIAETADVASDVQSSESCPISESTSTSSPVLPFRPKSKRRPSKPVKIVVDKESGGDAGNFTTSNVPNFINLSPSTTPPSDPVEVQPQDGYPSVPVIVPPIDLPPSIPDVGIDRDEHWGAYAAYLLQGAGAPSTAFGHGDPVPQPLPTPSTAGPNGQFSQYPRIGTAFTIYGNGTIDPSLISGTIALRQEEEEEEEESRSPTPTISVPSVPGGSGEAGPSVTLVQSEQEGEEGVGITGDWTFVHLNGLEVDDGKIPSRQQESIVGAGKGKGKGRAVDPIHVNGKGKGKGKDRAVEQEIPRVSRESTVDSAGRKRGRKQSAKAREASHISDLDADGSTVADGDEEKEEDGLKVSVRTGPPRKKRQVKVNPRLLAALRSNEPLTSEILAELAAEPTSCHQCHRKTHMEKMRCTNPKCGMRFCINCMIKRYPEIPFDPLVTVFDCPRCRNTCNCTICSRKRGETYVPSPHGNVRNNLPEYLLGPSVETVSSPTTVSRKSTTSKKRSHLSTTEKAKRPVPDPPTPAVDLPQGSFWGTIYGPDGQPVGHGFVGDGSNQIVIRSGEETPAEPSSEDIPEPPKKKRKSNPSTVYIGKLRDRWRSTPERASPPPPNNTSAKALPRAYLGRRVVLFDKSWKSLDELITLSDKKDQLPSSDTPNPVVDSPSKEPLSTDRMGFLLAEILGKADNTT